MRNVYVITGGGSGIGKAIVSYLPKDGIIIITGRNLGKLEQTASDLRSQGFDICTTTCDVSSRAEVKKLAEYAASLGNIKCVIHCAGISGSMADCETIIRINALGTVFINQEFYQVMHGGVICDVSSNTGYILPKLLLPSKKTYLLSLSNEEQFVIKLSKKAKLLRKESVNSQIAYMISKNFARWYSGNCAFKYMATKNIRVFSVSPGFVKTPMTEKEAGEGTENLLTYTGLSRGAEPEELAYLIAALCDEKCGYLIGTDILCDGGCVTNGYSFLTAAKKYRQQALTENW
ncbi:MAG: SDR family NAD(P)-dependent oxidoreductase [Eubacteriales bacterium]|nr:SDR family NAD(P)-dependent oxidoreductase [Eubacteriales bacterium]